jgi:hypothetical protein
LEVVMNDHVTEWLAAYHDGELSSKRQIQVETHLEHCFDCQVALQEIRTVSSLLQISPAAPVLTNPERFVNQVNLRLPREQLQPSWKRTLETGWRLVPFGLLGAWVFIQAVLLVSSLVRIAFQLGFGTEQLGAVFPLAEPTTSIFESFPLNGASLGEVAAGVIRLISAEGPFGWGLPIYLVLTVMIGLLYWSWLASWRIRRKQLQN